MVKTQRWKRGWNYKPSPYMDLYSLQHGRRVLMYLVMYQGMKEQKEESGDTVVCTVESFVFARYGRIGYLTL